MQRPDSDSLLDRIARLAWRAGVGQIESEARSTSARVAEGRFYLACVGQFKRGKSSLLDALLGDQVLPIGVLPVTALPTVVRYGTRRSARVLDESGEWREIAINELALYVSEEQNPENQKNTAAVEVFLPSAMLSTGMCFVDTPGLGSIFEANSAATYSFIPHIDAALIVLGIDPPITGEELSLVERINEQVENVLFVVSKADRASPDDLATVKRFACSILGERLGRPIEIYEVSASERLEGQHQTRDWPRLEAALNHIASSSGRRLVWLSQQRAANRLTRWLRAVIDDEITALTEPLEHADASLRDLDKVVEQSQEALGDLDVLLREEQNRLMRRLEERRQAFIARVLPKAEGQLAATEREQRPHQLGVRQFATEAAESIARAIVMPWLEEEEETVEEEYGEVIERFRKLANSALQKLADTNPRLNHLQTSVEGTGHLTARPQFQFNRLASIARPASPLRHGADFLLTALGMSDRIWFDARDYLARLIDTNTSRIQYDLQNRLAIARKELELLIRGALRNVRDVAREMLNRTKQTRLAGEAQVRQQVMELKTLSGEVSDLVDEVTHTSEAGVIEIPEFISTDN